MSKYQPGAIEAKWQKRWRDDKLYSVDIKTAKKPYYSLMMFPYPSAEGLHIGNTFTFSGVDVFSRFQRMSGLDVFEPIGLDGFGIHSENYAMKINKHPMELSKITEKHFYEQLMMTGNSYDWQRTVETYKPDYYRWTQWLFLQMYKKDLAFRKKATVNWCPSCLTVLADEQVISGECERCGSEVEQKELEQWFFKITDYAERLLNNLEWIDWSDNVKIMQRNWIGKSQGAVVRFDDIEVFTTRVDTIFGATFLVLSPEYKNLEASLTKDHKKEVAEYVKIAKGKTDTERVGSKDKTGVFTGSFVTNPLTGEKIPLWVADYVLAGYGTGAIMAVPAHDQRDFEFAKKYDLPIKSVIKSDLADLEADGIYTGEGVLINSGEYTGLTSSEARERLSEYIESKTLGTNKINYHLRDWLISRQRYWGPPIPIIYCDKCGIVPVPEADLPVELPFIENFRPTGTGSSPLATNSEFVNVKCPKCQGDAKRETDVSDTFLDSAWYFLRYPSTDIENEPFDRERNKKWLPVDMYIGGAEHAVLHLLYSRFVTMVLYDLGLLEFEEPFKKFRAHGLLIREGAKMSKSKGNVVNPDQYIKEYGADILRMSLLFLGPFSENVDFRDSAVNGVYRFLNRVWELPGIITDSETEEEKVIVNKTIKKVEDDIKELGFNTAIATLMELINFIFKQKSASKKTIKSLLLMLAPFAPHITEELWEKLGESYSIHKSAWPKIAEKYLIADYVTIVVQVNGRVRDQIEVNSADINSQELVEARALGSLKVQSVLNGAKSKKIIYVPGRVINLVI